MSALVLCVLVVVIRWRKGIEKEKQKAIAGVEQRLQVIELCHTPYSIPAVPLQALFLGRNCCRLGTKIITLQDLDMRQGIRTRYGEPSGCGGAGTRSWTL